MATKTTLDQLCTTEVDSSGGQSFKIASSLSFVKIGDLPHADIFVMQVVQETDPKADTFTRIASVVDLTKLTRGRDAALNKDETYYLAGDFSVTYTDVTTATSAKLAIQARVDQLIADWIKYTTEFITPPAIELPSIDDTVIEAAQSTYDGAKVTKVEKDAALAEANTTFSAAEDEATRAADKLASAQQDSTQCATLKATFDAGNGAVNAYRATMNAFATGGAPSAQTFYAATQALQAAVLAAGDLATAQAAATAFGPTLTSFNSLLTNTVVPAIATEAAAGQAVLTSFSTSITTACGAKASAVTTAVLDKTTADTAVAEAQTDLTIAQAEATAASTALQAALVAAEEICPDFTP